MCHIVYVIVVDVFFRATLLALTSCQPEHGVVWHCTRQVCLMLLNCKCFVCFNFRKILFLFKKVIYKHRPAFHQMLLEAFYIECSQYHFADHFWTCVWRYIPQSYDKVGKHVNNCGVYSYVMCRYTVYTLHTAICRWQVHTRKEVPKMCQPWAVLSQKCKAHYPHINQHINGTFFCFLFSRKHLQLVDGPLVFDRYIDYWRVVFLVRCFFLITLMYVSKYIIRAPRELYRWDKPSQSQENGTRLIGESIPYCIILY